jgi:glycerol-3-phosphate dehydrogenase
VANHVEVVELLKDNGKCIGATVKDTLTGSIFDIKAKTVIVTAGPWADLLSRKDSVRNKPRLRLTKGVHIVYRGQISDKAFLLQTAKDKRIFFIIPFDGNSLIGTTDTDYEGKPEDVKVEPADVNYLLKEASRIFPQMEFKKEQIITTFAGLRPLVFERGSPSKISRKHSIEKTFSGVWYVLGGKYTTYRAIAKECVQKILPVQSKQLPPDTHHPLYGSGVVEVDIKQLSKRYEMPSEIVAHLISVYGNKYSDVLKLIDQDASLRGKICTCSLTIRAQVFYSCKVEMARNFDDVFNRRLQLQYNDCSSNQCRKTIEDILKSYAF